MKPNVILILGKPGSGKGTQSSNVAETFKCTHLSAGELLRNELKSSSSEYRDVIKYHFESLTSVPGEITCALLRKHMDEYPHDPSLTVNNFIIDGFPPNLENLSCWETTMSGSVNLILVLHLDAPDNVCVERCLSRSDDRDDDNLECLNKRMKFFEQHTLPIIKYFSDKGLVRVVDAGKGVSEVFEHIKRTLELVCPEVLVRKSVTDVGENLT